MKEEELEIKIPIRWKDEQSNPQSANQFIVQRTPAEEIVITFGHISVPIYGSVEQQKKQAEALSKNGLTVQANTKIVLTLKTARQLQAALGNQSGDKKP